MFALLLSLRSYKRDGGISGGVVCYPHVGGVLGCDVMRGEGLLFVVAVYQEGAVMGEWEMVSRAVDRLRIWKMLLGVVGS